MVSRAASDSSSTSSLPSSSSSTIVLVISSSLSSNPLNHAHHFISIKLTSNNDLFLKTQLLPSLRGQNLHGFIDGSNPCPPTSLTITIEGLDKVTPNPEYMTWIQQDQVIMSLLISSLSEETMPIVIGLNTFKDIWDALVAALSSPSKTRVRNLHMQLQNLKQDDLTISHFLPRQSCVWRVSSHRKILECFQFQYFCVQRTVI